MSSDSWNETPDESAFDMDGGGIGTDDLGGGGNLDRAGWYHFEVSDVKPELDALNNSGKERTPCVRFDLSVLQSVDGQSPQGSVLFHRIYVAAKGGGPPADGSRNSAFRMGLGLGILKEVEDENGEKSIVDAATGEPKIRIATWLNAKGCQCIAKVEKESDDKFGDKFSIPFGRVCLPSDPSAKDIEYNKEAWALAKNFKVADPPVDKGAPKSDAKPATTSATATEAPLDDDLADL